MGRARSNPYRQGVTLLATIAALIVGVIALVQHERGWPKNWPSGWPQMGGRWGGVASVDGPVTSDVPPRVGGNSITIASFNIQTFGEAKLSRPNVVEVLARTIRRFDIIAIQEIRDKRTDALNRLVQAVNADGSKYDSLLGPALGRTTSTERYGFIYNMERIAVDRKNVYTVDDPYDLFHREPLVARFQTRASTPFTFTLINIHTDPDEVAREVNALADVLRGVQQDGSDEDDVMVVGDLNADPAHFDKLARVPRVTWAISNNQPTNTRRTATYDNVVFNRDSTTEFTGHSGVFDFAREFQLSAEDALAVSDHLPVWAEFSIHEQTAVATRPADVFR